MAMAASSLFLAPPLPKTLAVSASLFSHRHLRRNHLRPKLRPKPPTPEPLQLQQPPLLIADELVVIQEQETRVEPVQELASSESQPPLDQALLPNPRAFFIDLSLRLAALIAVQTAVAVWIFSRAPTPEVTADVDAGAELVRAEAEEGGAGWSLEFEKMISEIRAMAREARAREAKEKEENESESERASAGSLNAKGIHSSKLGAMKRLGFVRSSVVRRKNVGKGFDGEEKVDRSNVGVNGGVQQIAHQNSKTESSNLHKLGQSSEMLSELSDGPAKYGLQLDVTNTLTSQKSTDRSNSNHGTATSSLNMAERNVQSKQVFKKGEKPSAKISSKINGRSKVNLQKKETVGKSVSSNCEDDVFNLRKDQWWRKLPFVLAILLSRGSDHRSPKGLYSLKLDLPSDDAGADDSESYTIVFQDQGDATNFCYLLESFFEDLDGFSADIVPLRIDELEEGVDSNALKVIVVKKGQLKLFAGQPLHEVEAALRLLID